MKSIAVSPRHTPRKLAPRICWRRDLAVPHESLWSRWNKLELFNRATCRDIQGYLRSPGATREHAWERSAEAGDSRVRGVLDRVKLGDLSAPGFARTMGVIADYLPEAEKSRSKRDLWTAPNLRYCPQCLKAGVHVTYFQFYFVERCPVHGAGLRTQCPSCCSSIEYRHGWERCCTRFACSCRRPLWNWEEKPICEVTSDLKQGHAEAGEWVRAAMRQGKMLHYSWEYPSHTDRRNKKPDRIRPFATLAAHAYPELGRLPSNFSHEFEERIVTSQVNGGTGRATSERLRLVATYKAICRYLRRRLLRCHRAAIIEIGHQNCRPLRGSFGELWWRAPFAPAASAFIAWRMYWEGIESPVELDARRGNYVQLHRIGREAEHWTISLQERFYHLVSSPEWHAQTRLSNEVLVRWFAEVCLRVFDECLMRIHQQFQKKVPIDGSPHWKFTTEWIDGALVPLMLPRREKDGSATLFWIFPYRRAIDAPFLAKAIEEAPSKAELTAYCEAERLWINRLCILVSDVSRTRTREKAHRSVMDRSI